MFTLATAQTRIADPFEKKKETLQRDLPKLLLRHFPNLAALHHKPSSHVAAKFPIKIDFIAFVVIRGAEFLVYPRNYTKRHRRDQFFASS